MRAYKCTFHSDRVTHSTRNASQQNQYTSVNKSENAYLKGNRHFDQLGARTQNHVAIPVEEHSQVWTCVRRNGIQTGEHGRKEIHNLLRRLDKEVSFV